jgi:hypothetical protein
MSKSITTSVCVGLDVHKDSIDIAVAEVGPHGEVRHVGHSSSRVQAAKSTAALIGQVTFIVNAPRRSSTSVCSSRAWTLGAGAMATGTKSRCTTTVSAPPWRASLRHPWKMFALMPCDIATFATDAPGASHSARISALSCEPYRLRF